MTYKEFLNENYSLAENKKKEKEALKLLFIDNMNINNSTYYEYLDKEISIDKKNILQKLFNKYLVENIPVQYILGYTYFYSLKFVVNKNVLIPRNDTEVLVEEVLKYNFKNLKLVDIGTGSGCIAISLKKNNPTLEIDAIDISKEALEVAKENAKINNVKINFIENDLLLNLDNEYDIIVSNPPYIASSDFVSEEVLMNEPHLALFASNDGMYFYDKILSESLKCLKNGGIIFFEIGYNQKEKIIKIIKKYYPLAEIIVLKDYNGNDRVVTIKC